MNYRRLFRQFPKWGIAITIIAVSTVLFFFWWIRSGQETAPADSTTVESGQKREAPSLSQPTPVEIQFSGKNLFLNDRDLLEFRDGQIKVLAENWLQGSLGEFDQPVYLTDPEVIIIGGNDSNIRVFATSGKKIGNLTLSSGASFDGYINDDYSVAVFVKEGNLWRGEIDWPNAEIVNETQSTTVGYIQGRPLKGRLLGATGHSLVYRDQRFGALGIDLETGETQQLQFPANKVPSPSGRLIVGDTSSRPPQLAVFDVGTLEYQAHPIASRIPRNGLVWMSATRAALLLNNRIERYDHEEGLITTVYQTENESGRVVLVSLPVQNEPFLMIQDSQKGILLLQVETGETVPVTGPPATDITMLTNGSFLMSSDVADSAQRGTWMGQFDSEGLTRVFAQPLSSQSSGIRPAKRQLLGLPSEQSAIIRAFAEWHLLDFKGNRVTRIDYAGHSLSPVSER